jgi:N-acetylglucosaminyldiphosphoundecaprenol N-acetyl-beta-D-mannosaminyltransferase
VLGVRVDAVQIPDVVRRMSGWIESGRSGEYVAVTGMHGVMEAQKNVDFKRILNGASLVVPDGMPLVWMGKAQRIPMKRRVYGPELLETFCAQTGDRFRHFFYGGAPGVAERLGELLRRRFDIRVAGSYSPPFRPLNPQEEQALFEQLRAARPDILWVGLSTPKQEAWMAAYRERVLVPVLVGVGAAFDFHTGRIRQAPEWMRENGLEWFFRLTTEPRRLWHRYIVLGSQFVYKATLQLTGIRHYS